MGFFFQKLNIIIENYNRTFERLENDTYAIDTYAIKLSRLNYYDQNLNKWDKRPYAFYRCRYSGLLEFFFPIVHSGNVIAVLMYGQSISVNLKPEDMFTDYRDGEEENKLLNTVIETMQKEGLFNLKDNYVPITEQRINYISMRIEMLETRIQHIVEANAQKYISEKFFEIQKKFRRRIYPKADDYIEHSDNKSENLYKNLKKLDEKLDNYTIILNETLRDIFNLFNPDDYEGFIRIYAMESRLANNINPSKEAFLIIGDSSSSNGNSLSDSIIVTHKKIIFEKHLISEKVKESENRNQCIVNNEKQLMIEGKDLLDCMKVCHRKELLSAGLDINKDIFRLIIPFTFQEAYIIWEKYTKLDLESNQYKQYASYLDLFYHTLLEPFFILKGMKLEKDLENIMRISGHEAPQIILDVIDTINTPESSKFLLDSNSFTNKKSTITKPMRDMIDASNRMLLLNELFKRSSNIFKNEKITCEFSDFHRIIFQTASLFQINSYQDNKQRIIVNFDNNLNKYELKTENKYLNHILFNLIHNAIKHGLRGSNIYIKAKLIQSYDPNENKVNFNKIVVSIVSYGVEIKEEDKKNVFELYYRTPQAKKTEGMGMGLFIVKKLCVLLGYSIEISCKYIADYHLPMKFLYCKQNPYFTKDTSLSPDILKCLKDDSEYKEVINSNISINSWPITVDELNSMLLQQHTYKNDFIITIPIKDNLKFKN